MGIFESFIQNFSWSIFLLALAVAFLFISIVNLITSWLKLKAANENLKKIDAEFNKMQDLLKKKDKEIEELLSKGEKS